MNEISGSPLHGGELERLQGFLARHGLSWDEGIVHSVMLEDAGQVVACGSCRDNVIVCLAVEPSRRGENLLGQVFSRLVGWLVSQGRTRWFCFTKPQVRPLVEALGMHALVATDEAVMLESRRDGLAAYLRQVERETTEQLEGEAATGPHTPSLRAARVGAIVANCNPLTLGHVHLVQTAAAQVDVLHVFVLAAEQPFMPAADRLALVREATSGMPNVAVHSGGDYVLSPATFPTYFHKDEAAGLAANCKLDVELFARRIAPALGITHRFVGTEPGCGVTRQYNECMQELLPQAGIELVVVERLEADTASDGVRPARQAVSASTVRALVQAHDWTAVSRLVPACTLRYLTGRTSVFAAAPGDAPVTLEEMLVARDARVARQQELLTRHACTLVSHGLNIPGPHKTSPAFAWAFEQEGRLIENALAEHGWPVLHREATHARTGHEGLLAVRADALDVKRALVAVEEGSPLGRLFDIDVLRPDGDKVSRTELGLPGRTCLLCDRPAFECARSRAHSVSELLAAIEALIADAQKSLATRQEHARADFEARLAVALRLALIEELDTTPKPGLVDRRDCGSHADMDYSLFVRSADAVVPYLTRMGMAGYDHAASPDGGDLPSLFPTIQAIGREAEAAMFEATGGVNTHKGAIFTLGILAAAAGWQAGQDARRAAPAAAGPARLQAIVRSLVGPAMQAQLAAMERTRGLVASGAEVALTHGERVFCEHGIPGIRHEAALGFPGVFEVGLPALRAAGGTSNDAKLDALLAIMEALDDTNVVTRSGIGGLELVKRTAREIRAAAPDPRDPGRHERLAAFNDLCRQRNISPGGAADLLAASLFVFEIEGCGTNGA